MSRTTAAAATAATKSAKAKLEPPNRSRIYAVTIDKMKVPPALVTQRPFIQAHGDSMAADLDLNKLGLPVLNYRDSTYWILDGQHRIYALKQNGFTHDALECEVYEGLTDQQMAAIFLGRDSRKAISPLAKFHVACTAELPREMAIRRMVEINGLRIGTSGDDNTIRAVQSLGKVYDRSGEVVLGQVLRTIKGAYGGDAGSFHQSIIVGMGLLFHRFAGRANEKALAEALREEHHGYNGLLRRAEAQRERTGNDKAQCVASAIVDVFNKKAARSHKLPSWWKVEGDE